MKKTIGTILAVLCLAAALLLGSGTAFAQTAGQWTPREHPQDTIGCVNGAQSDEIIAQADRDLGGCKFTYRGKGKLTGWEVPLLEEGKDYKILSQSGRSITIEALDEEGCLPYINAKVQQPSAVPSTAGGNTSRVGYRRLQRKEKRKRRHRCARRNRRKKHRKWKQAAQKQPRKRWTARKKALPREAGRYCLWLRWALVFWLRLPLYFGKESGADKRIRKEKRGISL